jgi:2-isopropylmalate synthase
MHIQGTINGYGERTGNADLITLIANLKLKFGWDVVTDQALSNLTRISHSVAEIANQVHGSRQPYTGMSSFAHKAGLHASAIKVDANLYQHIDPELVGNGMRMLISDMAGRASIQIKAEQLGHDLTDHALASALANKVKERESAGYSFEAADASLDLLIRAELGKDLTPFRIVAWRVSTDQDEASQAVIRVGFDAEETKLYVGEGNGPVNALDQALREALVPRYPQLKQAELTDYRVRLLDNGHGTDATTRVLIDMGMATQTWTTVGVGVNVIEASWEALVEAYTYALIVIAPD